MGLPLAHLQDIRIVVIVVATQVQGAVEKVIHQFVLRGPPEFRRLVDRHFSRDNDFPFDVTKIIAVVQAKTKDIRRVVVRKKLYIQLVHLLVTDDRNTDLTPARPFTTQNISKT